MNGTKNGDTAQGNKFPNIDIWNLSAPFNSVHVKNIHSFENSNSWDQFLDTEMKWMEEQPKTVGN